MAKAKPEETVPEEVEAAGPGELGRKPADATVAARIGRANPRQPQARGTAGGSQR